MERKEHYETFGKELNDLQCLWTLFERGYFDNKTMIHRFEEQLQYVYEIFPEIKKHVGVE